MKYILISALYLTCLSVKSQKQINLDDIFKLSSAKELFSIYGKKNIEINSGEGEEDMIPYQYIIYSNTKNQIKVISSHSNHNKIVGVEIYNDVKSKPYSNLIGLSLKDLVKRNNKNILIGYFCFDAENLEVDSWNNGNLKGSRFFIYLKISGNKNESECPYKNLFTENEDSESTLKLLSNSPKLDNLNIRVNHIYIPNPKYNK